MTEEKDSHKKEKQNRTKQNKNQNKTKQNKTKQNKTKQNDYSVKILYLSPNSLEFCVVGSYCALKIAPLHIPDANEIPACCD